MENKNNNDCLLIDCQYKKSQGGVKMQDEDSNVSKTLTPDLLVKIREALAEGIARTLVYSAITELNNNA